MLLLVQLDLLRLGLLVLGLGLLLVLLDLLNWLVLLKPHFKA